MNDFGELNDQLSKKIIFGQKEGHIIMILWCLVVTSSITCAKVESGI